MLMRRCSPRSHPPVVLISVYRLPKRAPQLLYELLREREPHVNISHRVMPSWKQHAKFIASRPYSAWYLIKSSDSYVGAIYLTTRNEIAVSIFRQWRGFSFAPRAVRLLIRKHGHRRYLANVNPRNNEWIRMFLGLGFRLIQQTYECR